MQLRKVRVPFGVVGMVCEARPNVTADIFSLCLKTGNACVLKGGATPAARTRRLRPGSTKRCAAKGSTKRPSRSCRRTTPQWANCSEPWATSTW